MMPTNLIVKTKKTLMKIKKKLLPILLLLFVFGYSQTNDKIVLEWKISKNDTLKYKTTMNAVTIELEKSDQKDTSSIFSKFDFQKMRKSLSEINSDLKYQTNLFINKQNENYIDIEMKTISDNNSSNESLSQIMAEMKKDNNKNSKRKIESKDKEEEIDSLSIKNMFKNLSSFNNNIVLRGRISKTGEIISTYYKNSQKNLIAVLFELPNREVLVGEKWKLNLSLLEMDQNFICDSLSKENSVYIEKVIKTENDRIAVIKYNISEFVSGDFNNPMAGLFGVEKDNKTFMKITHIATGNFSIDKGKWISYEGKMTIETNFSILGGKTKTEFKLLE